MRLSAGTTATATVAIKPAPAAQQTVTLSMSDGTIASAPSSVVVDPTGAATFTVKGLKRGTTKIVAQAPQSAQTFTLPVDVNDDASTPSITSIQPPSGTVAGGTPVTINGANFGPDCSVLIGGVPTVTGAKRAISIAVLTPPNPDMLANVTVSCPQGAAEAIGGYLYVDTPTIASISPQSGSTGGGTRVHIHGTALSTLCWPFFGNVAARDAVSGGTTDLFASTPPHSTGPVDISVRCGTGLDASLASAFTYSAAADPAPVITSESTLVTPGQNASVFGSGFRTDDVVTIGGIRTPVLYTAPDFHWALVPELPEGVVSIDVTDAAGRTATTGPVVRIAPIPPGVSFTFLGSVTAAPGGELAFSGANFRPALHFQLDAVPLETIEMTPVAATVRLPSSIAAGFYTLKAVDGAGHVAGASSPIAVAPRPVITSITPDCVSAISGGQVIIRGSGFATGARVTVPYAFQPAAAAVIDANTIAATLPNNYPGPVVLTVTNPDGSSATLTGGLTYSSPYDPEGCASHHHATRY